ncbi:MAG: DUF6508 domain-containing protein [Actinomycetia bacterium]|nr:DUF6508 domain-containing protein [Actinomycetes bacterium]
MGRGVALKNRVVIPDESHIMTKFRTDLPNGAIDWQSLFNSMATAQSFSAMRDAIYASGTLRTGYLDRVQDDVVINEAVLSADLNRLRDLVTWIVRRDRFYAGVGDEAFWCGHLDAIFDRMGSHVGAVYPLPQPDTSAPRRIPPCPKCAGSAAVHHVTWDPSPFWRCVACDSSFRSPGVKVTDGRRHHT